PRAAGHDGGHSLGPDSRIGFRDPYLADTRIPAGIAARSPAPDRTIARRLGGQDGLRAVPRPLGRDLSPDRALHQGGPERRSPRPHAARRLILRTVLRPTPYVP